MSKILMTVVPAAVMAIVTLVPSPVYPDHSLAVARVNGITLYRSDLDCAVEASIIRPERGSGRDTFPGERALHHLIDIELLYQEGLKRRLPGIETEVERRYQAEVRKLGGTEEMAAALDYVDMTPEDLRKTIFRNLTINGYLNQEVYEKIVITDDDIREYYQANTDLFRRPETARIKQILIRVKRWEDPTAIQEAQARARTVHREAVKGISFAVLARKYSEDPSGGDMGPIPKGNLQTHIDSVVFSMPPGGISEPIQSRRGYHIFKVTAVTPPTVRPLEEVRSRIITDLRRRKAGAMIKQVLKDLRSKARIEILVK